MVMHRDLHVAAGVDQVASQADVLLAWGGVAAGVIVDDDDRGGGQCDGAGARQEASLDRPLARRKPGPRPEARN